MQRIVYYVAMSLDGYIAGHEEDVSGFIPSGPGVDQYFKDLQDFKTVIMGRKTYEFGYQFGLTPGASPYPWMRNIVFSSSVRFDQSSQVETAELTLERVRQIREESETDIYLCGGGELASWLLRHKQLDVLKVKLNPLILGGGIPLFGENTLGHRCSFIDQKGYSDGLQIITYDIQYDE